MAPDIVGQNQHFNEQEKVVYWGDKGKHQPCDSHNERDQKEGTNHKALFLLQLICYLSLSVNFFSLRYSFRKALLLKALLRFC